MRNDTSRYRVPRRIVQLAAIVLVSLILAAIVIQDHTSILPLGLVNAGRRQYTVFSNLCLIACMVALAVLIAEAIASQPRRLAGTIRGLLVFVVVLELLLAVADWRLANRPNVSLLGGPYREIRGEEGAHLILRKPDGPSPLGFRTDYPYEPVAGKPRLLFLGDSYTEGSGSASECNYPDVVERVLGEHLGREVEVMNAGVSGYGPEDALTLLRELYRMGYGFDAVVYNILIENDFSDNLPGTERHVVAGMAFRYPQSRFLRTFHPFNTRIVRWSLFAVALVRFERSPHPPTPGRGTCTTTAEGLGEISPLLRGIVLKGLDGNDRAVSSPRALQVVAAAIAEMGAETDGWGVPFAVVLFPNRALVDRELQEKLGLEEEQLTSSRMLYTFLLEELRGRSIFDTTELLGSGPGLYRTNDTHLSDVGNVRVGEWVGNELGDFLRGSERWETDG